MGSRKVELAGCLGGLTAGSAERVLTLGTDSQPGQSSPVLKFGSKAAERPPSGWAGTVSLASPVWDDVGGPLPEHSRLHKFPRTFAQS